LQSFLTSDLVHVGITAEDNRSHYVQTIERLDMLLRQVLDGSHWIEHLQTPGYWVIRDMDVNSGRPTPLIEAECRHLARWLEDFDKELARIEHEDGEDSESFRLVLDTSAIVRHKSFTDVDWTKHAGSKSVRLFIPILVIRQLDDLKDSGRSDKARSRLRSVRNALAKRGRGPAPIAARNTTVELLMDPPNHTRLPIADEEIIRRAQYLQGRPGGRVLLVTGDYAMQFMAEADDLPVLFLPDELRLGAASNSQEAGQAG
jgi:rRNA-processing protein FCF1